MTDAELAHTKELAFWMAERVFMNPISAKLLNEDWRKAFPDEVAVAERMKALVEALEKAQTKAVEQGRTACELFDEVKQLREQLRTVELSNSVLESRTVTDWIDHDGKWRPESLGLDELVYLKTRKQELKIPYPAGMVKGWMHSGGDMDVMAYKLASPQASTVTVKLPPKIERDDADGWFTYKGGRVGGGAAEWYNKALDDVGAELAAAGIREAE